MHHMTDVQLWDEIYEGEEVQSILWGIFFSSFDDVEGGYLFCFQVVELQNLVVILSIIVGVGGSGG